MYDDFSEATKELRKNRKKHVGDILRPVYLYVMMSHRIQKIDFFTYYAHLALRVTLDDESTNLGNDNIRILWNGEVGLNIKKEATS